MRYPEQDRILDYTFIVGGKEHTIRFSNPILDDLISIETEQGVFAQISVRQIIETSIKKKDVITGEEIIFDNE